MKTRWITDGLILDAKPLEGRLSVEYHPTLPYTVFYSGLMNAGTWDWSKQQWRFQPQKWLKVKEEWLKPPDWPNADRSFAKFQEEELLKLHGLALTDIADFKLRHTSYECQLAAICLAQGAGQHYVDGANGVKDFDVWSFFYTPFPARRVANADFGVSRFGAIDLGYAGRRVDLMGRQITDMGSPRASILHWLSKGGKWSSAWWLAQKSVVMLWPDMGDIIWRS